MRDAVYDDRLDHFIDEKKLATRRHNAGHKGAEAYCLECKTGGDAFLLASRRHPQGVVTLEGVEAHAFSKAAGGTLHRVDELQQTRGAQYSDTWSLPMGTPFVDHVLALPDHARPEWKRLLMCAAMIDIKSIRFAAGEWNADHVDDGIAYSAAFRSWRHEYG